MLYYYIKDGFNGGYAVIEPVAMFPEECRRVGDKSADASETRVVVRPCERQASIEAPRSRGP
jgi:hypothetical protein